MIAKLITSCFITIILIALLTLYPYAYEVPINTSNVAIALILGFWAVGNLLSDLIEK